MPAPHAVAQGKGLHVGRLAVAASSQAAVGSFQIDLEDALRTASLPIRSSSTRLHIRHMSLGRIQRGLSRQALARLIESKYRQINYIEACAGYDLPEHAEAVAFPDRFTAASLAIDAFINGQAMHWSLLAEFPSLAQCSADDVLVFIVKELSVASGGIGPGRLADIDGGIERLGRVIQTMSFAQAKDTFQVSLTDDNSQVHFQATMNTTTADTAVRVNATSAIIAYERQWLARQLDTAPTVLRNSLLHWVPIWGVNSWRTKLLILWLTQANGSVSISATRWLTKLNLRGASSNEYFSEQQTTTDIALKQKIASATVEKTKPVVDRQGELTTANIRPGTIAPDAESNNALLQTTGDSSEHAGLWLLLQVMRLVGTELADNATQCNLGLHVFKHFCQRLDLARHDPVLTLLETVDAIESIQHTPNPWQARPEVLTCLGGHGGLTLSRCGRGRAILHRDQRIPVVAIIDASTLRSLRKTAIRINPGNPRTPVASAEMIKSLVLSTQRLVSVLLGRGWRHLVTRPGKVLIGPTHIDVWFDARHVDPTIRSAGLDLDPGWVPSLGRVVSYHYDYSDVKDHESQNRAAAAARARIRSGDLKSDPESDEIK